MGEPLLEKQYETDDEYEGDEYEGEYEDDDEYDDDESGQEVSFQFDGETADYFRIWIVNLCLTLATLGVFSAWAKVRKNRFFYSHTKLGGTPFQYLGKPLPILKGRLIGVSLFAVWYLAENFWVQLVPVVLLVGAVLAPWVIVRSLAFNARYSAYRNQTFSFSARYRNAAGVLFRCALTILFTLGFGYPWAEARFKRFHGREHEVWRAARSVLGRRWSLRAGVPGVVWWRAGDDHGRCLVAVRAAPRRQGRARE